MNDATLALIRELEARTLAPDRPALEHARNAVREIQSPREACEALVAQGLLPPTFLSDGARRFAFATEPKEVAEVARLAVSLSRRTARTALLPTKHALSVALAADVEGFVAAETLAREAAARLWAWAAGDPRPSSEAPTTIVWTLINRTQLPSKTREHEIDGTFCAHYVTLSAIGQTPRGEREALRFAEGEPTPVAARAAQYVLGAHAWKIAVEIDAAVPVDCSGRYLEVFHTTPPRALRGRPFRALRDPFEPIVELWRRGYQLLSFGEDAILLGVAPA